MKSNHEITENAFRKARVRTRKKRTIIIGAISLCLVLVISISLFPNFDKIEFDFNLAATAKERVETSQYLPDPQNLSDRGVSRMSTGYQNDGSESFSDDIILELEDFNLIVDNLGFVGGISRSDMSVLDIKEEMYSVLNMVPAFGCWFQLPAYKDMQHAEDGYNNFYYRFDYDRSIDKLTMMRLGHSVTCSLYDLENDKVYSTYYRDDCHQRQMIRVEYFFDEAHRETVECTVLDYIQFKHNFYPVSYQYVKNVKNRSLTKIQIVTTVEAELYQKKVIDNPGGNVTSGFPLDELKGAGFIRKFVQLDYRDGNDIEMLKAEQHLANGYFSKPVTTNLAFYQKLGENCIYYTDCWDYFDESNSSEQIDLYDLYNVERGVLESWMNTGFVRQVMSVNCQSSKTVCQNCYDRTYDSGLLVYRCNHIKSGENVTRTKNDLLFNSESAKLLSMSLSRSMNNSFNRLKQNCGIEWVLGDSVFGWDLSDSVGKKQIDQDFENLSALFIENFALARDLPQTINKILKKSVRLAIKDLNHSAIATQVIPLSSSAEVTVSGTTIGFHLQAEVKSSILFEDGAPFSVSLLLMDVSNKIFSVIGSNEQVYSGNLMKLVTEGSYDLKDFRLRQDQITSESICLRLGWAITKHANERDYLCSEFFPLETENTVGYSEIRQKTDDFELTYRAEASDKGFILFVLATDLKFPEIKDIEEEYVVPRGSVILDILKTLKIVHAENALSVCIQWNEEFYMDLNEEVKEGLHMIVMTDRQNKQTVYQFNVRFKDNN